MINNFERGNIMTEYRFISLVPYESRETERSIWKNIPIKYLEFVKDCLAKATSITGCKYRIRYRGPRHDTFASHCNKRDAVGFSVYPAPR